MPMARNSFRLLRLTISCSESSNTFISSMFCILNCKVSVKIRLNEDNARLLTFFCLHIGKKGRPEACLFLHTRCFISL